jgi:hypothetical protein
MTRGSGATLADGGEKRSGFGRFLRYFLEPMYYWLDLKGADGRPSFIKVFGLISFALGAALLVRLWARYFQEAAAGGVAHPGQGELAFLLAFSFMVFLLPYGLKGLQVWALTRSGGTIDVMREVAIREPEKLRAQAELEKVRADIASRRAQGDGDFEATP